MNDLSSKIEETARNLKTALNKDPKHLNFAALKDLQKYCGNCFFETDEPLERVVSFIILKYLDEVFVNLLIDATYTIDLLKARIRIHKNLIESLPKISKSLKEQKSEDILNLLSNTLGIYINQIDFINKYNIK